MKDKRLVCAYCKKPVKKRFGIWSHERGLVDSARHSIKPVMR